MICAEKGNINIVALNGKVLVSIQEGEGIVTVVNN
jgi:hypothetical protein